MLVDTVLSASPVMIVIGVLISAERATTPKDVASHLIEILWWTIPNLYQTAQSFFQADDKRQQPTVSKKDQVDMDSNIAEARFIAADILQCIVKGL